MLKLTDRQRRICERVINVFETGSPAGKYGAISIYHDGPNKIRQITYGRSQTTEYGNLRQLVEMYVAANGAYSTGLAPYASMVGQVALVDNATFKDLLKKAGDEDPVMRSTQDAFFDKAYFTPARKWADANGFTYALSMLVIYDSFIHSGGILGLLRSRFQELPPAKGGDEKKWILQYVTVRDAWLRNHGNPDVRPSAYRTKDLLREIGAGNWDLSLLPINANGTLVDDPGAADSPVTIKIPKAVEPTIEFHGEMELPADVAPDPSIHAAAETAAALAGRILATARISLATTHVSGVTDQANARQNIVDTAAGKPASRSSYGNAPGGTIALDTRLLSAILELAEDYTFSISEFVGGSHSPTSRHYAGISADFNVIDGIGVSPAHAKVPAFKKLCRALGATEVLGPGDAGHTTHVHAAWPRVVAGQAASAQEATPTAAPAGAHDESVLLGLASDAGVTPAMKRLLAYRNQNRPASDPRYWAVVNFDLHSAKPRLFLFDRVGKTTVSYLCAHGKGSEGDKDDGLAVIFGNTPGSNCSSLGVYSCAEIYDGKHGKSMRLDGLEPSNSNARDRFVVVHGADYVSSGWIAKTGRIGRSDGCPALEVSRTREVIDALHGGSLMLLWKTP